MSTFSGRDVYEGLKATRERLSRERQEWRKLGASLNDTVSNAGKELDAAWAALGEVVLPRLDAQVLDDAARILALPQVSAAAIAQARERDRVELTARLAAIEGRQEWRERESRANAAQIRLAEVEDALAPLVASMKQLEREEAFRELVACGYDTGAYMGKFWHASYYRHWRLGDVVMERHGARLKAQRFADVRARYLEEEAAVAQLAAVRDEQRAVLAQITQLEQAHAQAKLALAGLDARTLTNARGRVRDHLQSLPAEEMSRLLASVPAWRVAGVRILGIHAKQRYLEELGRQLVQPFDEEARATFGELEQRIGKMSRPKKWSERVDEATFQKRIGRGRVDKWASRRNELARARDALASFDSYDRWDPLRTLTWWHLMTDTRAMPFSAPNDGDVWLWGGSDDARHAAAHAGSRRDSSFSIGDVS